MNIACRLRAISKTRRWTGKTGYIANHWVVTGPSIPLKTS